MESDIVYRATSSTRHFAAPAPPNFFMNNPEANLNKL